MQTRRVSCRETLLACRCAQGLLAVAAFIACQVACADGSRPAVGVGVGVQPLGFTSGAGDLLVAGRNAAPANFYLPVQLSPRLRIEPYGGFFHVSRSRTSASASTSAYSFSASVGGIGAADGFIPCTDGDQAMVATANRFYHDDPQEFLVLTVDLDATGSPWRFDDPEQRYPHIYGPIDPAAVLEVRRMVRDADGAFTGIAARD